MEIQYSVSFHSSVDTLIVEQSTFEGLIIDFIRAGVQFSCKATRGHLFMAIEVTS